MLPHIEFTTDYDLIETQLRAHGTAGAIYYSGKSCWWSHQRGHALAGGAGMICPAGGQIFMEKDWRGWLESARENPAHYGQHGMRALLAAHHANVRSAKNGGFYAAKTWRPYNEAIDALLAEEGGLRKKAMLRV
jgi:hypothetical protein